MSIKENDVDEVEYLIMHISTKEVVKRMLPVPYNREKVAYLNMKLAEWNRMSPGVWQYYTA